MMGSPWSERTFTIAFQVDDNDDTPPAGFITLDGNPLILPDRALAATKAKLAQAATAIRGSLRS